MTDFASDPMGLKLLSWNKPKEKPKEKPKPEPKPPAPAPTPGPVFYPGYGPSFHQYIGHQSMCMMAPCHGYTNFYPSHCYPPVVQQFLVLPAKKEEKKKAHVCVNCNEKKKCKACLKAEEAKKKYVCKPTFCNPRTSNK